MMSGGKRTNLINTFAGIKMVGSARIAREDNVNKTDHECNSVDCFVGNYKYRLRLFVR
jgi:hypothetical protein